MLKKSLFLAGLLLSFALSIQAQSSCSCNNSQCSASQSCPEGYIAICNCTATGCSSSCQSKSGGDVPEGRGIDMSVLKKTDSANVSSVLSKALGRTISFEPTPNLKLDWNEVKATDSYWDVLEFLSDRGNLTIGGQKFEVWKNLHDSILRGESFNMCFSESPLNVILNYISFISGKHFTVTEGNGRGKVSGPIQGNGVNELIEKLSKLGQVKIVEN